jgi:large repetitive protein
VLREYLRSHRSAVLTVAVSVVVAAVVATTAIVSSGYHTQRVSLDDGTVWVPSAQYGAVGRANTGVLQLNTAVEAADDTLSVVQDGQTVWSVDETKATITKVDTADATLGDPVTLPSGSPAVFLAGSTAVIGNADTGELWSTPTSQLGQFDASAKADLTLGADAVFDADDSNVAVYSPKTRVASLVSVGSSLSVTKHSTVSMSRKHDLQVAAVGNHIAVLDRTNGRLAIDGRVIALGDRVAGRASLQRSSGTGSAVVVASASGLLTVTPSGSITARSLAVSGTAARPYVDGSCTYAAWNGGQAIDTCKGNALQRLASMPGGSDLTIEHNGGTIVANDPDSGRSWAVSRSGQLIDNWSDLVQRNDEQQQEQTSDDNPQVDPQQKPPVAVDDDLGARPGRATVLPVLLNDYDPNGDPIVIDSTGSIDKSVGSLAIIDDRQQIQITLPAQATGTISFPYTISDGNGGTSSATVRVTVKPTSENEAPQQVRNTSSQVVQNGHVSLNVLGDWVDPDGDPTYLASATAPDGDTVTTTPDGTLDYKNGSGATGKRTVQIVVSDGRAEGHGSVTIDVSAQGHVELLADSFAVQAYAGRTLTVDPLDHVRGGNGTITLTSVPTVSRATVTPSYDAGTFQFQSDQVGDHQVEYTVTDGTKTASGIVRITVQAPPDASAAPITTPKTVFVNTLSTKDTDVTATDIDPAGGVLMVTGLTGLEARSGVQASVLDQHTLRVTLTAPLSGAVTFGYQETNGIATSTGSVTVIEIPKPDHVQPPVAQPDSATVRVGDVATIDVLANDSQPDGEALTLDPNLVQNVPGGAGLLFVSGDTLRYLAPNTPGNYTAVYRVEGPDGQYADATVSIAVREKDTATNSPPVPQTIVARTFAGQSVRVQVPLSGIDPDGDSVQLVGVASNPDKGSVSDITDDSLVYQAGDYSAGTDEFTYTVVDSLGARATGTIRVGIAPRANQAENPVAEPDHVTIRPGGSVTVRVLQNDSDPDGGQLTVSKVEPNGAGLTAKIVRKQEVKVTPPASAKSGDFAVLYTASNDAGGASTAFLTVTVDKNAAPLRPEASDTTLDLQDILHRKTITVDVLQNVFFPEGSNSALAVGLVPGYGKNAKVTADGRITVTLGARSQIIPFSVARRDHPDIVSYAFIHVPGFDDALPQVNRTAPTLTVKSESTISIPLSKYVVTANGQTAKITDPSTVKATHANGDDLVVNSTTLSFTSAKLYYGNASISFEVTDGSTANGGAGRTATLVLPIKVTPRANQPPSFSGSSIEMQPGDSRTIDLTKLTNYPYPKDVPELKYSVVSRPSAGTTVSISGQQMTIAVSDAAQKGTTASIGVGVADSTNAGRSGTVAVSIVASTRPLAQPAADTAVTRRGQTTTINVLANDQATNPFPKEALKVIAIRGLTGGIPAGVSITPSANDSQLSVSVASNAKPADTHLQYEVADATNDPDRYVWGDVTISVQDVPDQPSAPTRTGSYVGGQITLTWATPQANNSPITNYRVVGTNNYSKDCGTQTVCTLTGLDPTLSYRFSVTATNAIGASAASAQSGQMSADFVPDAPTGLTLQADPNTPNQLDASWTAVPTPSDGSSVRTYIATFTGPSGTTTIDTRGATTATIPAPSSGASYSVNVSAHNDADRNGTPVQWNSASATGTAVGNPTNPSGVNATATRSGNGTLVTITWGASDGQGSSIASYTVYRLDSQNFNCSSPSGTPVGTVGGGTTSTTDTPDGDGSGYYYAVVATNQRPYSFCASGVSGQVVSYKAPTNPSGNVTVSGSSDGNGNYGLVVSGLSASGNVDHYVITPSDGATLNAAPGQTVAVTPGSYGRPVSVSVAACRTSDSTYCSNSVSIGSGTPLATRASQDTSNNTSVAVVAPNDVASADLTITYSIEVCQSGLFGAPVGCSTDRTPNTPWKDGDPFDSTDAFITITATVVWSDGTTTVTRTDPSPQQQSITPGSGG